LGIEEALVRIQLGLENGFLSGIQGAVAEPEIKLDQDQDEREDHHQQRFC